jgi:hypothetical protein
MSRMRGQGIIFAAVLAVAAAPAAAWSSPMPAGDASVSPDTVSTGSHFKVDATTTDAGFRNGQLPTALSIAFQKGFALDPTAVAGTCTTALANKDQCPADSRLGAGAIGVSLNGAHYTASIEFFRTAPPQPTDQGGIIFYFKEPQSGFNGSSVGSVRTVDQGIYGELIQFDKLPLPNLPPGLNIQLDHLQLDLGAGSAAAPVAIPHHTTKKKHRYRCVKYRGHGRRHHCVKWKRIVTAHKSSATSFIINPATCTGTWGAQLTWGYQDGTQEQREATLACRPA